MMSEYKGYRIEVAGSRGIKWKLGSRSGWRRVPFYSATKWVSLDGFLSIADHFTADTLSELKSEINKRSVAK